jgi:hypothetical protein
MNNMKQDEFKDRFYNLISIADPMTEIKYLLSRAILSSQLVFEKEPLDSHQLAKTLYHAILRHMALQHEPLDEEELKVSDRLLEFFNRKVRK